MKPAKLCSVYRCMRCGRTVSTGNTRSVAFHRARRCKSTKRGVVSDAEAVCANRARRRGLFARKRRAVVALLLKEELASISDAQWAVLRTVFA